jgi:hypothetical protein
LWGIWASLADKAISFEYAQWPLPSTFHYVMVIMLFKRCIFYEASIRDYLYFMIISTEDLAEWVC